MRTLPLATVWLLAFAVRGLYLWQIADAPFFGLRLGDAEADHEWGRRIEKFGDILDTATRCDGRRAENPT